MKLKKLNSTKEVPVSILRWRINWDKKCRSNFQFGIKQWLKPYWRNHVCLEEFVIPGSRLSCDLVNLTKRVVVEMNGVQHDEYNKHFHNGSRANFLSQIKRDQAKRGWCESNGFLLVEILPQDLPLSVEFFLERFNLNIK